ncbi:discoidin domain-containing protein [Carboxylicivirga mesophila]|uniref:Discoidin domain-containing protein n=1 Tax=Carboxylicivirga mesophila TaxID=1166478 RepID=A0ABS5K8C3_9BACT|nr:discoidin domain-containing protein [Carboxylicivirga mesophila]MBS2211117.1 discoidin domain-containing protein [Carboxylicivirga mesophila]
MKKRRISEGKCPKIPKRNFMGIYFFAMALMVFSLTSCDSDDEGGSLPVTTTVSVTDIKDVSAVVNGAVTSDGGSNILAIGVCWIQGEGEPTIDDNYIPVGEYTKDGILEEDWDYSIDFEDLSSKTDYSVRSYVANAAGVSYGETITFTSKAGKTFHTLTADMIETHVQEPYEGPKEGLVDGDPATFWHSAWSIAGVTLPAHIQINFSEEKSIGGFNFMTRFGGANGNDADQFDLQTSADGVNFTTVWESAEVINALVQPEVNVIAFDKNYTSKYFRIRILNTRSRVGTSTHMAELQVFEDGLLPY